MRYRVFLPFLGILACAWIPPPEGTLQSNDFKFSGGSETSKSSVLVAKKNLPKGIFVRDPAKYFEQTEVPASEAPEGPGLTLKALQNRWLLRPLAEGSIVTLDCFSSPEFPFLAFIRSTFDSVPKGHMLIPVLISSPQGNWTCNVPVDVLVVSKGKNGEAIIDARFKRLFIITSERNLRWPKGKELFFLSARPDQVLPILLAHVRGELILTLSQDCTAKTHYFD